MSLRICWKISLNGTWLLSTDENIDMLFWLIAIFHLRSPFLCCEAHRRGGQFCQKGKTAKLGERACPTTAYSDDGCGCSCGYQQSHSSLWKEWFHPSCSRNLCRIRKHRAIRRKKSSYTAVWPMQPTESNACPSLFLFTYRCLSQLDKYRVSSSVLFSALIEVEQL